MDRMQAMTDVELNTIHNAAMEILERIGVAFHDPAAIDIFKKHGVKTDGNVVLLKEAHIEKALKSTPSEFTIHARDPQKDVVLGGGNFIFTSVLATPYVVSARGEQSQATMKDYDNFCKLVQVSKNIGMNAFYLVTPWDLPPESAHLRMFFSNLTLCDKPIIGASLSRRATLDMLEMAGIVWGGKEHIKNFPVIISLITALSPLQYPKEVVEAMIEFARYGQPLIMTGGPKAGTTGPITLSGTLALHNAQILAGIALAQFVRPGAPIAYGGVSGSADLKSGNILFGGPELSKVTAGIAQMAKYYNIPSRSGGALTDAHLPDIQAGIESTMSLLTAVRSGIDMVSYACGMLGSFLSINFEKFIIDDELCGKVRSLLEPIKITEEEIDVAAMAEVGIGGEYLTHEKTLERCRTEFFTPTLMKSRSYDSWNESGMKRLEEIASDAVQKKLSAYEKPFIDPDIEQALARYVSEKAGS